MTTPPSGLIFAIRSTCSDSVRNKKIKNGKENEREEVIFKKHKAINETFASLRSQKAESQILLEIGN